jgi:hypothetical protein
LKGYDVDCELFEDFPAEDTFLQEQSVLVELDDDGQRREIPYRKRWRLRDVDHDDEVDFDSLKVGKAISAYWSPNRAYYGAIVIGVRDAPAGTCCPRNIICCCSCMLLHNIVAML